MQFIKFILNTKYTYCIHKFIQGDHEIFTYLCLSVHDCIHQLGTIYVKSVANSVLIPYIKLKIYHLIIRRSIFHFSETEINFKNNYWNTHKRKEKKYITL